MSTPINFGILGCAEIARKLCRAITLSPNSTLIAVGSRSIEKSRKFLAANSLDPNSVSAYGSYDEVLNDPRVEAVYVPLPTSLHIEWAVKAARSGKHLLLEKPVAMSVAEFDRIVEACRESGVQFMDATMWMHHPRTEVMRGVLDDLARFGELKVVHSIFSFAADPDFLENDIRVKPDLDGLGSLGDLGWYCIRSILWAVNYELPKTALALPDVVKNNAGVILSCGSRLIWEDGKVATFDCSFLAQMTMELSVVGTKGTLHLSDFVIPFEESSAQFSFASDTDFTELVTGWKPPPSKHVVTTDLPQEARMVQKFSRLASSIRDSKGKPDDKWPSISRKTQLVLDAVKASIDKGYQPVEMTS